MSSTDDLLPALVLILGTALLLTLLVAYAAYKCTTEQLRTAKVVPSAQADAPPAPPPPHPVANKYSADPTQILQELREATAALKGFRCRPSSPCAYERTASPALTPSLQQETVGMGTSEAVAHLERVCDRVVVDASSQMTATFYDEFVQNVEQRSRQVDGASAADENASVGGNRTASCTVDRSPSSFGVCSSTAERADTDLQRKAVAEVATAIQAAARAAIPDAGELSRDAAAAAARRRYASWKLRHGHEDQQASNLRSFASQSATGSGARVGASPGQAMLPKPAAPTSPLAQDPRFSFEVAGLPRWRELTNPGRSPMDK